MMKPLNRKFLFITFLLTLLLFVVVIVSFNVYIFATSSVCEDAYLVSYLDKRDLLIETENPRIIIVGDSSAAYGIDSGLIEDTFDMPVINTSINGSIGMLFAMNAVEPYIQKDDIVLLSSSHKHWNDNRSGILFYGYERGTAMWELLLLDFSNIRYLTHPRQLAILWQQHLSIIEQRMRNGIRTIPDCIKIPAKVSRWDINKNGDYIGHLDNENVQRSFDYQVELVEIEPDILALTNEFARSVWSQGAEIYFVLPPLAASLYETDLEGLDAFAMDMRRGLDFPILGETEQFVYPDDIMYDTVYHLHTEGREMHTRKLIAILKDYTKGSE